MKTNETFGNRLAKLRKEHNLTQEDLAKKLNISAQAISKWENDLTAPDIDTLIKLSDIFNISLDELLKNEKSNSVIVNEKKDINKMMLKILVKTQKGDNIKVNLPVAIIKIFLENGNISHFISGNKMLEGIDFAQLFVLIEQGIIGELVSMENVEGDHVTITVE